MTTQHKSRRVTDDSVCEALEILLGNLCIERDYARHLTAQGTSVPERRSTRQPRFLFAGDGSQEPSFAAFSQIAEELRAMPPVSRNKPAQIQPGTWLALMFAGADSAKASVYRFDPDVNIVKLVANPHLELRLEDRRHGHIVVRKMAEGWILQSDGAYGEKALVNRQDRPRRTLRYLPSGGAYTN